MGTFKGKSAAKAKPRVSALAAASASSEVAQDREPKFEEGTHRVTFRECEQPAPVAGKNPWLIVRLKGAGDSEEIGERAAPFCISSKSLSSTGPRVKSLCMALIGMGRDEEDDYNSFDPHGEFVDAVTSNDLEAAAAYYSEKSKGKVSEEDALEALTSTEILAVATLGGEADDGSRYVNVSFKPAPDAEGDEDSDDEPESEPAPKAKAGKKASAKPKAAPVEEDEDDSDDDSDDEDDDPESEPVPAKRKAKAKRK
jgi:hypothetical protein